METILSVCGLLCNECRFFTEPCPGCHAVKGATFWASKAMPHGICPLYYCASNEKKYRNCGECSELPCKKFMDLRDPDITEEEHARSIRERVGRLK